MKTDRAHRISIVGLGETGTAISQLLLNKYRNIQLNIMDINPNIEGRVLDLSHAGIGNDNMITVNNTDAFASSEVIFFCAGVRNLPGQPRDTMAVTNHFLLKEVFGRTEFINQPDIIVISNPVDEMVTWISRLNMNVKNVIGTGTLLDTWRLKLLLANHLKIAPEKVTTSVFGEHGNNLVPIWSKTFVDGESITEIIGAEELNEIEVELKNIAKKIRQTQNATKYGVASVSVFLLECLNSSESTEVIVSICEDEAVAFGRPVKISAGNIQFLPMDDLTTDELGKLKNAREKIENIVRYA